MSKLTRREFLLKTSAAGLLITTGGPFPKSVTAGLPSKAIDRVMLGNTGIEASYLAFGTGVRAWLRKAGITRLGEDEAVRIMRYAYDQGINFFDSADIYGTHQTVARALEGVPRENYVLLSKIWTREESWLKPSGGAIEEVDRFRKEYNTDMLDIVLIHSETDENWPESRKRVRDELSELKQRGVIRAHGISCHNFEALRVAANHPWTDVIFARINYMGGTQYKMDNTSEEVARVLRTARQNGKAVVGMKIYGEGSLTDPDQMNQSLKFVIGNDLVSAMTIGMLATEEVDDNISRITKTLAEVKS